MLIHLVGLLQRPQFVFLNLGFYRIVIRRLFHIPHAIEHPLTDDELILILFLSRQRRELLVFLFPIEVLKLLIHLLNLLTLFEEHVNVAYYFHLFLFLKQLLQFQAESHDVRYDLALLVTSRFRYE